MDEGHDTEFDIDWKEFGKMLTMDDVKNAAKSLATGFWGGLVLGAVLGWVLL